MPPKRPRGQSRKAEKWIKGLQFPKQGITDIRKGARTIEQQAVIDWMVNNLCEGVAKQVAEEFNRPVEEIRNMLAEPTGKYETSPEYERYYAILEEFLKGAEHA